ncbi:MAG TPA: hypothetical protein VFA41_16540 [Ktedonobacteraceae bacterium]|jgi:hypothetical protein|nr:hypothetical protein [Ktedonobacteraceae bacterium]
MDLLRETAPFLVGLFLPPLVMLAVRPSWTGQLKFVTTFLAALVLGICASTLAGELAAGFPDNLIAILIDTSLVYLGSQVAYRFFWKPVLEPRLSQPPELSPRRVRK